MNRATNGLVAVMLTAFGATLAWIGAAAGPSIANMPPICSQPGVTCTQTNPGATAPVPQDQTASVPYAYTSVAGSTPMVDANATVQVVPDGSLYPTGSKLTLGPVSTVPVNSVNPVSVTVASDDAVQVALTGKPLTSAAADWPDALTIPITVTTPDPSGTGLSSSKSATLTVVLDEPALAARSPRYTASLALGRTPVRFQQPTRCIIGMSYASQVTGVTSPRFLAGAGATLSIPGRRTLTTGIIDPITGKIRWANGQYGGQVRLARSDVPAKIKTSGRLPLLITVRPAEPSAFAAAVSRINLGIPKAACGMAKYPHLHGRHWT